MMKSLLVQVSKKGIELIGTLLHGALVLILFWVAIDMVQQHVATGPQRPGFVGVAMAPLKASQPEPVVVSSRTHDYGYFKSLEAKAKSPAPVVVAKVQTVTPKVAVNAPRAVVAPVQMVRVAQPLPICHKDHKGNRQWGPWCQSGSSAL